MVFSDPKGSFSDLEQILQMKMFVQTQARNLQGQNI